MFKVTDRSIPTAVLLYCNTDYELDDDDTVMFISSVRKISNEDNETVYAVCGYSGGEETVLELSYGQDLVPDKGDLIRFRLDSDGYIEKWEKLCDYDSSVFEHNTVFDDTFSAKYDSIIGTKNSVLTAEYEGRYKNYRLDESTVVYNISFGSNAFSVTPCAFTP